MKKIALIALLLIAGTAAAGTASARRQQVIQKPVVSLYAWYVLHPGYALSAYSPDAIIRP